jgi:Fe-S cluster biogenesis protein NfuA
MVEARQSDELRAQLSQMLNKEIVPALRLDGLEIEVLEIASGTARVRMAGACPACPSTVMSVVMMMEQEIRRLIPSIEYLEVVP